MKNSNKYLVWRGKKPKVVSQVGAELLQLEPMSSVSPPDSPLYTLQLQRCPHLTRVTLFSTLCLLKQVLAGDSHSPMVQRNASCSSNIHNLLVHSSDERSTLQNGIFQRKLLRSMNMFTHHHLSSCYVLLMLIGRKVPTLLAFQSSQIVSKVILTETNTNISTNSVHI